SGAMDAEFVGVLKRLRSSPLSHIVTYIVTPLKLRNALRTNHEGIADSIAFPASFTATSRALR
ncbi:MAG: hypothetical protein E6501_31175, partial [Bradyrhizobium sp.]|nr:hypothetical protein [Bradyrhizobium sp.]